MYLKNLLKTGFFILSICSSAAVFAQNKVIDGKVTDVSTGANLPGVSVIVKGSAVGTVTDGNGYYKLSVPSTATRLVFSFIGYDKQERDIAGDATVNIALSPNKTSLNEVVVIGYGTQDRHKVTSAIATVSGEELTKRAATDATSLLQGQLPGLSVAQNSGEPGNEGFSLTVRGPGTFSSAGTSPLVIVDGIPGSLSALNPTDIESVTLLKDAASEAIYGSLGANGVLVVTTKKGKNTGGFSLDYTYSLGVSNPTRLPSLITNSATYMTLYNEAEANSGLQPIYTAAEIASYQTATNRTLYPNNNPLDEVFKTAYVQNHFLNLSGGNNGTTYYIGFGVTDQPGTMIGFSYNKYTLSMAVKSKVSKRVTFGVDFQGVYGNKIYPEDGSGDLFLSTLAQAPTYPLEYEGHYIYDAFSSENHNKNPLAIAQNVLDITNDYYSQGDISLNIDIVDGLKWENQAGFNFDFNKTTDFRPLIQEYQFPNLAPVGTLDDGTSSSLNVSKNDNEFGLFHSQFDYSKQFGKHSLSAIAGFEEQETTFNGLGASRINFPTNELTDLNGGPAVGATNYGYTTITALRSLYSRFNYDYDDKYLFGASYRRDGSSNFLPGHQWGTFYSFSGGWRVSKENFLKDVSWINDLKLRGSWGLVGNQNIGPYSALALLSQSSYPFGGIAGTGFGTTALVDPSITWESTRTTDVGVDLTAFNNKLSFTADYFNKYTYNILRGSQVAGWVGLSAPTVNGGAMDNKGMEFVLTYRDKIGKDFGFSISPNVQYYRNKLVSFGAPQINGETIDKEGLPYNSFYMYVFDGIFQNQAEINSSPTQPITPTPGDIKLKDENGDGKITAADMVVVPGAYPDYTFSANINANYKQFDLNIQFYGVEGIKNYVSGWGIEPFLQGSIPTTDWLNAWTPTNHSNTLPKIYIPGYEGVDGYSSTYFLKDASFVRVKNVQIGYTVPAYIAKKIGFKNIRIYAAGDNVLLFTKFPGLDPERNYNDGLYLNYPQNRTFTFGINAKL